MINIQETSLLKEAAPITPCQECQKYQEDSEKLRNDLLKAAKLRNEMEAGNFICILIWSIQMVSFSH